MGDCFLTLGVPQESLGEDPSLCSASLRSWYSALQTSLRSLGLISRHLATKDLPYVPICADPSLSNNSTVSRKQCRVLLAVLCHDLKY
jgi:hypothetical protein